MLKKEKWEKNRKEKKKKSGATLGEGIILSYLCKETRKARETKETRVTRKTRNYKKRESYI